MPEWSIDPGFYEEPTNVPTGDECEVSLRGENCGRTDCDHCGEDAAAWLCAAARMGVTGIVALAREVLRVAGSGAQYVVAERDLMRLRDRSSTSARHTFRAWSWTEGVLDAVVRRAQWLGSHEYRNDVNEQAAYMVGRLLVELHMVNEHLTKLETQAMADAQEVK